MNRSPRGPASSSFSLSLRQALVESFFIVLAVACKPNVAPPDVVLEPAEDVQHDAAPIPTPENMCFLLGDVTCHRLMECTEPEDRKETIADYETCVQSWNTDHDCAAFAKEGWCIKDTYEKFYEGEAQKCLYHLATDSCEEFLGWPNQHCEATCRSQTTVVEEAGGKTIYFDDAPLTAEEWKEAGHPDYQDDPGPTAYEKCLKSCKDDKRFYDVTKAMYKECTKKCAQTYPEVVSGS